MIRGWFMEKIQGSEAIIRVCNISKSFGNNKVLEDINFQIRRSQIVSLLGGNGAGKSTLIKILSGVHSQDKGYFYIKDRKISSLTPKTALKNGITTVYQDLSLVNTLDVASNIFLGRESLAKGFFLDRQKMKKESRRLIEQLNIDLSDLNMEVGKLSGGQRQGVAIARAINQGGEILILDEPTAAMGVKESKQVFDLINLLSRQGYTIIIISHNVQKALEISDRLVILRNGRIVADVDSNSLEEKEVVHYITGVR